MNFIELVAWIVVLGCPVTAGLVAAMEKAGWFTILFVAIGLAVGYASAMGIGWLSYILTSAEDRYSNSFWSCGLFIAYILIPPMAAFGAMAVTGWVTVFIIKLLF